MQKSEKINLIILAICALYFIVRALISPIQY
jgi:hypothetical protein